MQTHLEQELALWFPQLTLPELKLLLWQTSEKQDSKEYNPKSPTYLRLGLCLLRSTYDHARPGWRGQQDLQGILPAPCCPPEEPTWPAVAVSVVLWEPKKVILFQSFKSWDVLCFDTVPEQVKRRSSPAFIHPMPLPSANCHASTKLGHSLSYAIGINLCGSCKFPYPSPLEIVTIINMFVFIFYVVHSYLLLSGCITHLFLLCAMMNLLPSRDNWLPSWAL